MLLLSLSGVTCSTSVSLMDIMDAIRFVLSGVVKTPQVAVAAFSESVCVMPPGVPSSRRLARHDYQPVAMSASASPGQRLLRAYGRRTQAAPTRPPITAAVSFAAEGGRSSSALTVEAGTYVTNQPADFIRRVLAQLERMVGGEAARAAVGEATVSGVSYGPPPAPPSTRQDTSDDGGSSASVIALLALVIAMAFVIAGLLVWRDRRGRNPRGVVVHNAAAAGESGRERASSMFEHESVVRKQPQAHSSESGTLADVSVEMTALSTGQAVLPAESSSNGVTDDELHGPGAHMSGALSAPSPIPAAVGRNCEVRSGVRASFTAKVSGTLPPLGALLPHLSGSVLAAARSESHSDSKSHSEVPTHTSSRTPAGASVGPDSHALQEHSNSIGTQQRPTSVATFKAARMSLFTAPEASRPAQATQRTRRRESHAGTSTSVLGQLQQDTGRLQAAQRQSHVTPNIAAGKRTRRTSMHAQGRQAQTSSGSVQVARRKQNARSANAAQESAEATAAGPTSHDNPLWANRLVVAGSSKPSTVRPGLDGTALTSVRNLTAAAAAEEGNNTEPGVQGFSGKTTRAKRRTYRYGRRASQIPGGAADLPRE